MEKDLILAIDQGTTGSKALLFDAHGNIQAHSSCQVTQHYPKPGWVEHDLGEIWTGMRSLIAQVVSTVDPRRIAAVGVTNQRETAGVWHRLSGEPLARAVVWQCRRSSDICRELIASGHGDMVRSKTGLMVDPYFSGTKLAWLLRNTPGLREQAEQGDVCFGTIDSWLVWNLTGRQVHATDYSNASRTILYNIYDLDWDSELLDLMGIPSVMMPSVAASSHLFGYTRDLGVLPDGIPITGVIGDSQAALFGEACFRPGMAKATYGTGTSIMVYVGEEPVPIPQGLVLTLAWGFDDPADAGGKAGFHLTELGVYNGDTAAFNSGGPEGATSRHQGPATGHREANVGYALEGIINVTGATMQWLSDGIRVIENVAESEAMARSLDGNDGVYMVPAFVGLGAPYWDMDARGLICGITRGTTRAHLVRAGLESIAYQVMDVVDLIRQSSGVGISHLRADGGATANGFLMQFQSDILGIPVTCPPIEQVSALGAAYMAGLRAGVWESMEEIASLWRSHRSFLPGLSVGERVRLAAEWRTAVGRALITAEG